MDTSFDSDDDFDSEDDDDGEDDDFEDDFDQVKDSDEDGFSDSYEEFIGSDPKDPTDLPFYPYEEISEPFPKKTKTRPHLIKEEEKIRSISLAKRSPTRNRCLLFLILFIFFLILTPFIVFIILS